VERSCSQNNIFPRDHSPLVLVAGVPIFALLDDFGHLREKDFLVGETFRSFTLFYTVSVYIGLLLLSLVFLRKIRPVALFRFQFLPSCFCYREVGQSACEEVVKGSFIMVAVFVYAYYVCYHIMEPFNVWTIIFLHWFFQQGLS